ncbi:hypothetical protein A1O3_09555 [Capronia epimyces CBS 606.96]|uniref:FAD-binding domain-containing protein n=1 Tax=Capronia epimyces CBS 606.96 TaxID=1182542 RepID=W9Y4F4_9EURO|nr:uncharacterized protein A1O3_09555 [Capronia epimyces CBS 606.96]EXJ77329.1 hypothetical protein A1O3_09555 [Capronia epimyces CBS 606.96]
MPLKVAIVGGGVGGLTLAVALQHNPNLNVNVYERATELKEIGAVVGLAPNGLRTLEKLGVHEVLTDEVGWRNKNRIPMIFKHWKTGEILGQDLNHNVPEWRHQFARMHRAKLQKALLAHIPPKAIHLGKKAVNVEVDRSSGATVTFSDGTRVHADILIGADGIRSGVRGVFVPNHELVWNGDVVLRSTFDYSLVEDLKDIPQNSSHFTGPDGFFFGTRIGSDQFAVTASFTADPATDPEFNEPVWNAPASVETLREKFRASDWHPVVPQIIERVPWLRRYANVAGRELDQWTFADRVTLLGDAAHTHGGAFAAGASLAIDDAYTLSLAFDEVFPPTQVFSDQAATPELIARVLGLYERIRRPHAAKVLALVHQGKASAHKRFEQTRAGNPECDADFRKRIANRLDPVWLTEHDAERAFRTAAAEDLEDRRRASRGLAVQAPQARL